MRLYFQIFSSFFRIGAFTIGGGYAMIPLIQDEVVERKRWLGEEEFIDMLALAQSVPGILAINTSVFVGYRLRGIRGSIVAALGCALPSFLMILLIALCFMQISDNPVVESIFKGIRPAVVALIVAPLWKMSRSAGVGWSTAWIPVVAALLIWKMGVSPIVVVLLAIVGGVMCYVIRRRSSS